MSKIIFSNSETYNASAFSAELTGYAAGYKVPDVTGALDFIAPPVLAPARRFEYAKFGDGDLIVDIDDERAAFGDFKIVKSTGKMENAKLIHRGLTLLIDEDEMTANYQQRAIERLKRRLLRNELARAAAMLIKAATNSAKKWMATGSGKSTPDGDLRKLKISVGEACGITANRMLCGEIAWSYRYDALVASTAPGEGVAADKSPEQLGKALALEEFRLADERYEFTDTTDGSKKMGNIIPPTKVFAFNASKGVDIDDPSTFKRFFSEGGFKVYEEKKGVVTAITVHHYSLLAQTGVGACRSLTISNS
jgi:hypothetical protein